MVDCWSVSQQMECYEAILIERGALVDLSAVMSSLMFQHQDCFEPLDKLSPIVLNPVHLNPVQARYLEEATFLIEKGAVIDSGNAKGCMTLLWLACVNGDFEIAQLILDTYSGIEESKLWCEALSLASAYHHNAIVKLLLGRQELVHYGKYSYKSITSTCIGGHVKVVRLLLGGVTQIDAVEEWGGLLQGGNADDGGESMSALVYAVRERIVLFLLDRDAQYCAEPIESGGTVYKFVDLFTASCCEKDLLDSTLILHASKHGLCDMTRLLLEKGAHVDLQDSDGMSALMFAVKRVLNDMTELLLEKGAQVNLQDSHGMSPLMFASQDGHYEIAKLLLKKGAQVDLEDINGKSALNFACDMKQYEMAEILLESGAHVKLEDQSTRLEMLWFACEGGNLQILRLILGKYPWVNKFSESGRSPLMFASERGFCEMAGLLLDMGAQVDLQNSDGMSALMFSSNQEVAKLMLDSGAQVDLQDNAGRSALMCASKQGFFEVAKLCVDKGAQVDLKDINGKSALNFACDMKQYEMAEILLESGAHVKLEDQSTRLEMLWFACKGGNLQILRLILGKYPWVNKFSESGRSPLMFASERGFCEMAGLLLDMGAQVDLQNCDGMSALMFSSNQEVAKLMLDSGAQVDLQDNAGRSALMCASKQGFFEVAKLCVDKGDQVDLQDSAGRSALAWACRYSFQEIDDLDELRLQYHSSAMSRYNGNYKIAKLLLESGAKLTLPEGSLVRLYLSACKQGDCGVVKLLLDTGVEVDATVKFGMGSTGLMHASKGGHCELVELLLGRGSRVNQQYVDGKSSLMYASEGGHAEVVELLLKAGARADLQAQFGVSAKKLAEERNHVDIVKLLEDPAKVSNMLATITSIPDG